MGNFTELQKGKKKMPLTLIPQQTVMGKNQSEPHTADP